MCIFHSCQGVIGEILILHTRTPWSAVRPRQTTAMPNTATTPYAAASQQGKKLIILLHGVPASNQYLYTNTTEKT